MDDGQPPNGKRKKGRVRSSANREQVRLRGVCEHCGTEKGFFETHHIVPKSLGGGDELENLACLCGGAEGCHTKHHRGEIKFQRVEDFSPPEESFDDWWRRFDTCGEAE